MVATITTRVFLINSKLFPRMPENRSYAVAVFSISLFYSLKNFGSDNALIILAI